MLANRLYQHPAELRGRPAGPIPQGVQAPREGGLGTAAPLDQKGTVTELPKEGGHALPDVQVLPKQKPLPDDSGASAEFNKRRGRAHAEHANQAEIADPGPSKKEGSKPHQPVQEDFKGPTAEVDFEKAKQAFSRRLRKHSLRSRYRKQQEAKKKKADVPPEKKTEVKAKGLK
jgi:hypothetical protein